MRTRTTIAAGLLGVTALLTACSVPQQDPAAQDSPSSTPEGSGDPNTLTAVLGSEEYPDAFEISLLDSEGNEVTELPAGEYTIKVADNTEIHNFHLTGNGVEETTGVAEVVETEWTVNLEPGEYTYICDPHPRMTGSFTVTESTASAAGSPTGPTGPALGAPGHNHAAAGHAVNGHDHNDR